MAFKDNLYHFRSKANLSQQELADKCGVTRQAISAYELGSKTPSVETLILIAKTLNCTTDELLHESK